MYCIFLTNQQRSIMTLEAWSFKGIEQIPDDESNLPKIDYPILKAIAKYENHCSILRIKNYTFEFINKPEKILRK